MKFLGGFFTFIKENIVIALASLLVTSAAIITPIVIKNLNNENIEEESNNDIKNIECEDGYTLSEDGVCEIIPPTDNNETSENEVGENTTNPVVEETTKPKDATKPTESTNKTNKVEDTPKEENKTEENKEEVEVPKKEEDTNKPEEVPNEHEGMINLNDNVKYYVVKNGVVCFNFIRINTECLNKTLKELKELYPDYTHDEYIDSLDESKVANFSSYAVNLVTSFPKCKVEMEDSIGNTLKGLKLPGVVFNYTSKQVFPEWLNFENKNYGNFSNSVYSTLEKYNLYNIGACGSSDYDYDATLDEDTCLKYNLSCARW